MQNFRIVTTTLVFVLFLNCSNEKPKTPNLQSSDEPVCGQLEGTANRGCRQWIDRVSRALLKKPVTKEADFQKLEKLSNEQIVSQLMTDPDLALSILDFNIYYLGFKNGKTGVDWASRFPSATAAALEVLKGGDYFKFFDYEQPFYPLPVQNFSNDLANELENYVSDAIQNIESQPEITLREACDIAFGSAPVLKLQRMGAISLEMYFSLGKSHKWNHDLVLTCNSDNGTGEEVLSHLRLMKPMIQPLIEDLKPLRENEYSVKTLQDLKPFDAKKHQMTDLASSFPVLQFWSVLTNSSTNFNRKRASYVLKRYFCDDLTPIKVEQPEVHAGDAHASDSGCMSCHYKLDPMAGFFKNIGWRGVNYTGLDQIYLDDEVTFNAGEYDSHWKQGNEWNIGYIRSVSDLSLNTYGESLTDLFQIIRNSTEVRECVVKRLYKYFLDEAQTWDAGYLQSVSEKFTAVETSSGSTEALKETIKGILLSKTFSQSNRDSNVCYDFRPGTNVNDRPPCEVAAILETNCLNCHSSKGPSGGLALDKWLAIGEGHGFQHIKSGTQLKPSETFGLIVDRLSSDDPEKRMPLNSYMPNAERTALYLWAESQVSRAK